MGVTFLRVGRISIELLSKVYSGNIVPGARSAMPDISPWFGSPLVDITEHGTWIVYYDRRRLVRGINMMSPNESVSDKGRDKSPQLLDST